MVEHLKSPLMECLIFYILVVQTVLNKNTVHKEPTIHKVSYTWQHHNKSDLGVFDRIQNEPADA